MKPVASETKDLRRIRKGCTNKEMRALILEAIKSGARYRMTKNGVMFFGEQGAGISTHFTCSDHRAVGNFRTNLRLIGIITNKEK